MPGGDGDGAPRHGEPLGEEPYQLVVRGAVYRRSGKPDFQGRAVAARDARSARVWDDVHEERRRQKPSPMSSSHLSANSTNIATMGLTSNMPTGGTTRRMGSTNQSVRAYTGRIQRA